MTRIVFEHSFLAFNGGWTSTVGQEELDDGGEDSWSVAAGEEVGESGSDVVVF